jgi:hypothetical protein
VPASVNVARASPASAPRLSRSRAEERSPDLMKSSARWNMEANSSRSSCRVTNSGNVLFGADDGSSPGATGTDRAGATAVNSLRSNRLLGSCRFPDSCAAFAETPPCPFDSGRCSKLMVAGRYNYTTASPAASLAASPQSTAQNYCFPRDSFGVWLPRLRPNQARGSPRLIFTVSQGKGRDARRVELV